MLVVPLKEGESIEKALKKFKKKFEKTGILKELRERQKFTKPSVERREEIIHAVYKRKIQEESQNA
jgi:small subunit ribosomal protein S21